MSAGPHEIVTVHTPQSAVRHPLELLRSMVHDIAASRDLAWRLFLRDLSAQYRQSVLGYLWVFVPSLVAALPFVLLKAGGVVAIEETSLPYPAFAVIGAVIWQSFTDGLTAPLRAVSASRSMLTRVNFPREAILLAALAQIGFSVLVRLLLVAGVFAVYRIWPAPTVVLFPLGMASVVLAGFVVGLAVTPIGTLYSDVQQALPVAATFLMYLTPVLYPMPKHGLAADIARLNPLTPLVTVTRDWLTTGASDHLAGFLAVSSASLVCLVLGWIAYRLAMPHLIARLGN